MVKVNTDENPNLASQFNQLDQRLGKLTGSLDDSIRADVSNANELLSGLAKLNQQIRISELQSGGTANDLRDLRQQKIEELAKLVKIDITSGANGTLGISVAGTEMVSGDHVADTLQAYDAGEGRILVRGTASGAGLALTGGRIQGTIDARDSTVAALRADVKSLASALISEVNTVHETGFSLTGGTGEKFFTGTNAADIRVNAKLVDNPALVQASAVADVVGDNRTALALAQQEGDGRRQ
jgi:flagellar hook-associated protein 1 FlgK